MFNSKVELLRHVDLRLKSRKVESKKSSRKLSKVKSAVESTFRHVVIKTVLKSRFIQITGVKIFLNGLMRVFINAVYNDKVF